MTPFITVEDLFNRCDSRWIGKNLLDDGTAATEVQMLNPATTAGTRLLQLITDASEELMAAAAVGARYTEDELRTNGGNLLISIVAGLTLGPILERRQRATEDVSQLSATYKRSAMRVEELRRGERIFFSVPNVPEAGLPTTGDMSPGPAQPPLISQLAGRYFGFPAAGPFPTGPNPYWPSPGGDWPN